MAQHSPEYIREEIKRLLKYAPPEMRAAAIALLPAAKRSLNTGYHPCLRGVPMLLVPFRRYRASMLSGGANRKQKSSRRSKNWV